MTEAPHADESGKPVPIRLHLPGANYRTGNDGRPIEVSDAQCVGVFDPKQQHWIDQKSGARVYPSQWQPLD